MEKIKAFLETLKNACFYGEIVIKMEHGKIVHVRKIENIKL